MLDLLRALKQREAAGRWTPPGHNLMSNQITEKGVRACPERKFCGTRHVMSLPDAAEAMVSARRSTADSTVPWLRQAGLQCWREGLPRRPLVRVGQSLLRWCSVLLSIGLFLLAFDQGRLAMRSHSNPALGWLQTGHGQRMHHCCCPCVCIPLLAAAHRFICIILVDGDDQEERRRV
jgi:hypothetical protein